MTERLLRQIRTLPLFAALNDDELARLIGSLETCDVPAQTLLFREGRSEDYCFILVEGRVEILKELGTEDERLLGVRDAATFIGEMSLLAPRGHHTASVRALTPLHLLRVTRADFEDLLKHHPQMAYDLAHVMSERLSESENLTIRDLQEKNRQLKQAYNELLAAHKQIVEKEKLEHELALARQIQRSILPRTLPSVQGLDLGVEMVLSSDVSGDFYDFIPLSAQELAVVIGDVSDKGMPAALFMSLTYSLVRAEADRHRSPAETLKAVNHHLLGMNGDEMFVTILYGRLNATTGQFRYARAGHENPLVHDAQACEITLETVEGQPLGLFDDPVLEEGCVTIPPGGTLFTYTDGLTEATDDRQRFYGPERLRRALRANYGAPAAGLCRAVWNDVAAFVGRAPQQDDMTLVAVRVGPDLSCGPILRPQFDRSAGEAA